MLTKQTIEQNLQQAAKEKIRNYPCNNLRASELGHPCERYLVYSITNWQDRAEYDETLQYIFDLGNAIEAEVIRRIKEAGYEVLTGIKNFRIDKPLITGREDIMIRDPESGEMFPCEIKGLAPNSFDSIHIIDDMLHHKQYYIQKYPAQLLTYMFHYGKEKGFFILFNKVNGRIKIIDASLDYEYYETLLQKAERVYRHIDQGSLPEIPEDITICEQCSFLHICGAKVNHGISTVDNGKLEKLLAERERLLPLVKEFESIKKLIKLNMREADIVFTPNYIVRKKMVKKKPFIVAGSIYCKEIIQKVGGNNHETD